MKAQMVKWGNSLAVRIPKPVAEEARLKEGDSLEIEAVEGRVELRRASRMPTFGPSWFPRSRPQTATGRSATGAEVGKEVVEW